MITHHLHFTCNIRGISLQSFKYAKRERISKLKQALCQKHKMQNQNLWRKCCNANQFNSQNELKEYTQDSLNRNYVKSIGDLYEVKVARTLIQGKAQLYRNAKLLNLGQREQKLMQKLYLLAKEAITECQNQNIEEIESQIDKIQQIQSAYLEGRIFREIFQVFYPQEIDLIVKNQKRKCENQQIFQIFQRRNSLIVYDFLKIEKTTQKKMNPMSEKVCRHLIHMKINPLHKRNLERFNDDKAIIQQQKLVNCIKQIMKMILKTKQMDIKDLEQKYIQTSPHFVKRRYSWADLSNGFEMVNKRKLVSKTTVFYFIIEVQTEKEQFIKALGQFSQILRLWFINFGAIMHVICYNVQSEIDKKVEKLAKKMKIQDEEIQRMKIQDEEIERRMKIQDEEIEEIKLMQQQLERKMKIRDQELDKKMKLKDQELEKMRLQLSKQLQELKQHTKYIEKNPKKQ